MENQSIEKSNSGFITDAIPYEELEKMCERFANSTMAPEHLKGKPGDVFVILQTGYEIGMKPHQAMQQIVPINGLPSIKGDGAKALIMSSGKCKSWEEKWEGEGDDLKCTITSARSDNGQTLSSSFSVRDAKKAGLWDDRPKIFSKRFNKDIPNPSPWYCYPKRMIKYRALGFIARDLYPDVMQGMVTKEEAMDMPISEVTETVKSRSGEAEIIVPPSDKGNDLAKDMFSKIEANNGQSDPEEAEIVEDEQPVDEKTPFTKEDIPELIEFIDERPFIENKKFRSKTHIDEIKMSMIKKNVSFEDINEIMASSGRQTYLTHEDLIKKATAEEIGLVLTKLAKESSKS